MKISNDVLSRGLRRVEQLLRGPHDAKLGARGFRAECRLPLGDCGSRDSKLGVRGFRAECRLSLGDCCS